MRAALLLPTMGLVAAVSHAEPPGPEELGEAIRAFGGELKSTLVGTIQNEGLTEAIAVCQDDAPRIAGEVGARTGLELRRTARRVRNPDNRPSEADLALLDQLEAKLAAGEAPEQVSVYQLSEDGETATLARPIMMGPPCLACHGETLAPEIAEEIRARYPEDEATGFEVGTLRGAFIATGPAGN